MAPDITWLGGMPLREIETAHRDARSQCAFFREDWSIKPIGQMWLDLKEKDWSTSETGRTNSTGKFHARGFHGQYEIVVSEGNRTRTVTTSLGTKKELIRVALD